MQIKFSCWGHENVTARHENSLEFTKDSKLSLNGDCIIGVKADFSLEEIRRFIEYKKKNNSVKNIDVKITIKIDDFVEDFDGILNEDFNDENEIVIRKSEFLSERTLVIKSSKVASEIDKKIIHKLQHKEKFIVVIK